MSDRYRWEKSVLALAGFGMAAFLAVSAVLLFAVGGRTREVARNFLFRDGQVQVDLPGDVAHVLDARCDSCQSVNVGKGFVRFGAGDGAYRIELTLTTASGQKRIFRTSGEKLDWDRVRYVPIALPQGALAWRYTVNGRQRPRPKGLAYGPV